MSFFVEQFVEEFVEKFEIEINYYEIKDVQRFTGIAYWPEEFDEPRLSISIMGQLYESD